MPTIQEIQGTTYSGNTTGGVTRAAADSSAFADLYNDVKSGSTYLDDIFQRAADKYGLPVNLLKAIGKIESAFTPDAVSSAGAMGIMQLMPDTAKYLGVTDPFDPEQNIMGGAKLLAEHLEQYGGNLDLAIAAYNCGVGTVAKYGGEIPPFTQNYINVLKEVLGGDLSTPDISGYVSSGKKATASSGGAFGEMDMLSLMIMTKLFDLMSGSGDDKKKVGEL